ncbi:MAG: hypothetical protein ABSH56_23695 [Bryobacteraceae bacterium]|jgi:hypothetical protein
MPWTHKAFWITPLAIGILLLLSSVAVSHGLLRRVYHRKLAESPRERLFLASTGYFTAALVVRAITLAIHYNIGPFHDVSMHGRHIHHLVWGILLLLVVGYGWLLQAGTGAARSNVWAARAMCMGYGVGAALTLDEFALWLNLRDVYWEREGRESFEAMAVFAGALCIGIFGRPFFFGVAREIGAVLRGSGESGGR